MPALRWKGNGFLPGVPARDLSAEEAKEYGGINHLVGSGLYEVASTAKMERQPKEDKAVRPKAEDKREGD